MYDASEQARASLITAMAILLVLNTVTIAARVYVRTSMIKAFGWDDATLCVSFVGFVIACILGFAAVHFGYAYDGPPEAWPGFDREKAAKYLYGSQVVLYIGNGLAKLAVALVLYRLAVSRCFKAMLIASMVFVVLWALFTTMFASWLCNDHGSSNWASSSTCNAVGLFRTISNVFVDYFYAVLPVFIVRNAKMNTRTKVSVCILLGLGLFASAATIAKLVIIAHLPSATGEAQNILHYQLLTWAIAELGLTVFCAAAAALRPLLRRLPRGPWGSAATSSHSGGSSSSSKTPLGGARGAPAAAVTRARQRADLPRGVRAEPDGLGQVPGAAREEVAGARVPGA